MGIKFRGLIGPKSAGASAPVVQEKQHDAEGQQPGADKELNDPTINPAGHTGSSVTSDEAATEDKKEMQFGVQVAEATLQVWTKEHLIAAYVL